MMTEVDLGKSSRKFFQITVMKTANGTSSELSVENLLGQSVRIPSFNMADSYNNEEIPIHTSGGFVSGPLRSVYASKDLVAIIIVDTAFNTNTKFRRVSRYYR